MTVKRKKSKVLVRSSQQLQPSACNNQDESVRGVFLHHFVRVSIKQFELQPPCQTSSSLTEDKCENESEEGYLEWFCLQPLRVIDRKFITNLTEH